MYACRTRWVKEAGTACYDFQLTSPYLMYNDALSNKANARSIYDPEQLFLTIMRHVGFTSPLTCEPIPNVPWRLLSAGGSHSERQMTFSIMGTVRIDLSLA